MIELQPACNSTSWAAAAPRGLPRQSEKQRANTDSATNLSRPEPRYTICCITTRARSGTKAALKTDLTKLGSNLLLALEDAHPLGRETGLYGIRKTSQLSHALGARTDIQKARRTPISDRAQRVSGGRLGGRRVGARKTNLARPAFPAPRSVSITNEIWATFLTTRALENAPTGAQKTH